MGKEKIKISQRIEDLIPPISEQYNFKSLTFISDVSDTIYLWNGKETICVKESNNSFNNKNRKLGQIMSGFTKDKVDFEKIYKSNSDHFLIGNATYIIISKV